jgi:hypothetical protein
LDSNLLVRSSCKTFNTLLSRSIKWNKDYLKGDKDCDRDIETKFGEPLWEEAGITSPEEDGTRILITPMPVPGLWRLDKIRKGEII